MRVVMKRVKAVVLACTFLIIVSACLFAACGSSGSSGGADSNNHRAPSTERTRVDGHPVLWAVEHVSVGGSELTYVCFFTTSGPGGNNTNSPWCDRVGS